MNKLVMAVMLFTAPLLAMAAEYNQLQSDQSRFGFVYKQMGVTMEGDFSRFDARLSFEPQRLDQASAEFVIVLDSIDTGFDEGNDEVKGKLWFDSANHRYARFVSSKVEAAGDNRYQISGELSIKGKSRHVSFPVAYRLQNDKVHFSGELPIKRLDYGIGEGMWADTATVADQVVITFEVVAAKKP